MRTKTKTKTRRQSTSDVVACCGHVRDDLEKTCCRVEDAEWVGEALKRRLVPASWLLICMLEPELIQMRDKFEYVGAQRSLRSTVLLRLQSWHSVQMGLFFPGSNPVSRGMLGKRLKGGS